MTNVSVEGMDEYSTLAENLTDLKVELMSKPFKSKADFETFRDRLIQACGQDWPQANQDLTLDYGLYSRLIESYPEFKKGLWLVYRLVLRNYLERIFPKVMERAWVKFQPRRDFHKPGGKN